MEQKDFQKEISNCKNKAIELFLYHYELIFDGFRSSESAKEDAKKAALFTVDEMYFTLYNYLKSKNELHHAYQEFADLEELKLQIKSL
jgi:hypothetical protein